MDAYFLTQTIKSEFHTFPIKKQFALTYFDLVGIIKPFCSDWHIWPELTEHQNVHYHGILYLKDTVKFFKTIKKLNQIGFYECTRVKDIDKVTTYSSKDQVLMKELLNVPLPLSKSNYLPAMKKIIPVLCPRTNIFSYLECAQSGPSGQRAPSPQQEKNRSRKRRLETLTSGDDDEGGASDGADHLECEDIKHCNKGFDCEICFPRN